MKYRTVTLPVECGPFRPPEGSTTRLDLVVPFTTPKLTREALIYAGLLAKGLDAAIRVVRVQVVPFPLPIDQPPVSPEFLTRQMTSMGVDEAHVDLRFSRDFDLGVESSLTHDSVVVVGSKHRAFFKQLWPTHNERLAAKLRAKGYTVCLT